MEILKEILILITWLIPLLLIKMFYIRFESDTKSKIEELNKIISSLEIIQKQLSSNPEDKI